MNSSPSFDFDDCVTPPQMVVHLTEKRPRRRRSVGFQLESNETVVYHPQQSASSDSSDNSNYGTMSWVRNKRTVTTTPLKSCLSPKVGRRRCLAVRRLSGLQEGDQDPAALLPPTRNSVDIPPSLYLPPDKNSAAPSLSPFTTEGNVDDSMEEQWPPMAPAAQRQHPRGRSVGRFGEADDDCSAESPLRPPLRSSISASHVTPVKPNSHSAASRYSSSSTCSTLVSTPSARPRAPSAIQQWLSIPHLQQHDIEVVLINPPVISPLPFATSPRRSPILHARLQQRRMGSAAFLEPPL